jgi:hypothetical protein
LSFFPKESTAIPDRPVLTMVVLSPDEEPTSSFMEQITDWTRNCGQSPRQFPGGIFWLVSESGFRLREGVADWLAWNSINRDAERNLLGELDPHDREMVPLELRKAKDVVEEKIWSLYNRLLLWSGKDGALKTVGLGQMHPSEARSITGAIMARLRQDGWLNREVAASYIERNWPPALKEKGAWSLAGLREAFYQGHVTRLEKADEALRQMVLHAVMRGIFGLGVGRDAEKFDRAWINDNIDPAEIVFDYETYLLLPWRAKQEKEKGVAEPPPPHEPPGARPPDEPVPPDGPAPPQPPMEPKKIEWRGNMPKDKWNLFGIKVLTKLGGAENISIEVTVRSKTEDPSLKQQLNNALRDLGLDGDFKENL